MKMSDPFEDEMLLKAFAQENEAEFLVFADTYFADVEIEAMLDDERENNGSEEDGLSDSDKT